MSVNLSPFPSFPILDNNTFSQPDILKPIHNTVNCVDLHGRSIQTGMHFVPGPDECTLCVCNDGGPIWCKAVLCSPPQDCKSFRVGNSCCEFICLDDTIRGKGNGSNGGPFGPVDSSEVVPKIVIASVCSMLSLALLSFLVYRLRQRHIQGRLNSAEACHSAQMCDECDDTRSLDFSNDCYFERPGVNSMSNYFPPHYLASWKPPSHYFPPSGEAPPPYEIACATTSNCFMQLAQPASTYTTNQSNSIAFNVGGMNSTILTNENINRVPNASQNQHPTTSSSRVEPQISSSSTVAINSNNSNSSNQEQNETGAGVEAGREGDSSRAGESTSANVQLTEIHEQEEGPCTSQNATMTSTKKIMMTDTGSSKKKLKKSSNDDSNEIIIVEDGGGGDPLQGPSQSQRTGGSPSTNSNSTLHDRSNNDSRSHSHCNNINNHNNTTTGIVFNPLHQHHHHNHRHHYPQRNGRSSSNVSASNPGVPPPTLLLRSTSEHPNVVDPELPPYSASFRDCFRHSLTLPRHPRDALEFGMDLDSEEYSRRQRFSLQFNLADWTSSASSSTLSLSTPNTPLDRPESSSSSTS